MGYYWIQIRHREEWGERDVCDERRELFPQIWGRFLEHAIDGFPSSTAAERLSVDGDGD